MNRIIYETEYYAVEETKTNEIVVFDLIPESASVVVIHNGCIMLVSQYREAVGEHTLELPGGTVGPGEDRTLAVQRELEEETGVLCGEITYLGSAYPMASLANRKVFFYFTEDVKKVAELRQANDEDVPVWVPLREVYRNLRDGGCHDAALGHALLLCTLRGLLERD
ncbi:NUDIX hydrolase [Paenibacillus sp. DMB20]|uniref:NUDIX hydrolase n=1 Tax=Paenibacillus sp. DMB20 TaxID=1642570 RepID=UPI0006276040|nr:NUDIX hydrolase [Paenibacillus sp. DMB20]KKO52184.1 NUDIX hydrolase [Paenibacillus sp. DMB20]